MKLIFQKKSGDIILILSVFCLLAFLIFIAGCTENNLNDDLDILNQNDLLNITISSQSGITNYFKNMTIEVISDEVLTTENIDSDLITSLKGRITSIFPKIISDSIKNPEIISGTLIPEKKYLAYKNVKTNDGITYEIRVELDTGNIITCYPVSAIMYPKNKRIISPDDAKEISAEFLKGLVKDSSDNYLEEYANSNISTYYAGGNQNPEIAYGIFVQYSRVIDELNCLYSQILTEVDSVTGDVIMFYEHWPDLSDRKFTSSEPEYSLEYAKNLVKSKIEEKYPEDVKSYDFSPIVDTVNSKSIEPVWFDDDIVLTYNPDAPVDLVWAFYFRPELNEGIVDSSGQSLYSAVISAHSGDIYELYYKDIRINQWEKYNLD